MTIQRITKLLSRLESELPNGGHPLVAVAELGEEIRTFVEDLDHRIHDIQDVLDAKDLGPQAASLELLIRGLAEQISVSPKAPAPAQSRRGDPIVAWRDMVNYLAEGTDRAGLPEWVGPAFRQVTNILRDDTFPCIFARQANHLKSGWICAVDSLDTDEGREAVRRAVIAYLGVLKRFPRERTIIMPLLVIVRPCHPMRSLKEYREQAWGLFQYLHDHDPEPWPMDVPNNPDRGDWSFCFGGIQLFSNVSAPAHAVHKSRNLGDSLVFAMQPRTNFDLVGGNNRKGRRVREEIRARAERYEGRPVAKHLGFYGTPENREWLQMATKDSEDDLTFPATCPFKFRHRRDPNRK